MEFRPCIDIHNGRVKQIVGGSLKDKGDEAFENFVSDRDAAYYALMYRDMGLKGGHVIMLNAASSEYYEATKTQALSALKAAPGFLQVGGGINDENAEQFLDAGASHVIVTSFVFRDGKIDYDNLELLKKAVGSKRIVLDLSCRKKDGRYMVVTDRWQRFTDVEVEVTLFEQLGAFCDEFLIHGVDCEGKSSGFEEDLIRILASYKGHEVTYAGGIADEAAILRLKELGDDRINVTVGSALDIFGGKLLIERVKEICIQ